MISELSIIHSDLGVYLVVSFLGALNSFLSYPFLAQAQQV